MIRTILTLIICLGCTICSAQRDSSLTEEFGKLSAKQRTKIALKEQEDAARDTEFNALMARAEKLFQARSYDEALAVFKEARRRRPYNVHPKVKIQDLEAFIKERDRKKEPKIEPALPPGPTVSVASTPMETVPAATLPKAVPAKPMGTVATVEPTPTTASAGKASTVLAPKEVARKEAVIVLSSTPAQGERIYKEGASIVIERAIQHHDRIMVYRKVVQPSGATVHFEDGRPITQREWDTIFFDR